MKLEKKVKGILFIFIPDIAIGSKLNKEVRVCTFYWDTLSIT